MHLVREVRLVSNLHSKVRKTFTFLNLRLVPAPLVLARRRDRRGECMCSIVSSWGREDPGEDLCLDLSATSKIDNLGAKSDLLANIEKQLKSGDVSKSVEHEERELADGDAAQELRRGVRVLRTGVHRRVHVAVPSVGDHLSVPPVIISHKSGATCLGEFEQRLTVLLLNHFFLHLSLSCVCKDWQLQLEPLSSSCVLGTLHSCPQLD